MKIWIPKYRFQKYGKNGLFLATLGNLVLSHKYMDPNPPTVVSFLLVDSCRKNKIRTNKPEIQWKNKNSEPQPKLSDSY